MRGELPMDFSEFGLSGLVRFLGGVERLTEHNLPVLHNSRLPFIAGVSKGYAGKARSIIRPLRFVAAIIGWCRKAQIGNSIVCSVHIDVIDLVRRPDAMEMQPSDAVRVIGAPANLDLDITVNRRSCNFASEQAVSAFRPSIARTPAKHSRFWAVIKDRANKSGGKGLVFGFHAAARLRFESARISGLTWACKPLTLAMER